MATLQTLSRRDFIAASGAFALAGCSLPKDGCSYTVPILGDTHFDETQWGRYHVGWKPRDERDANGRKREFARNSDMWRERMPSLISAAAKCARPTDAFVLQVGDLVQGDCPDLATATLMFKDGVAACRKGFENLPFVTVAGNHDIRNGAREAYDRFFVPFHSRELGKRFASTTFCFRQGPDLWMVADFMNPDVNVIFSELEKPDDARYVFFVCHSPVTPTDNWGFFWFLFGKPEDAHLRRKLRFLLTRRRVIVLCGHTHYTELNEWRGPEGGLTQFSVNSVFTDPSLAHPKLITDDPATWGRIWVEKHVTDASVEHDGHYTTRTRKQSMELVAEYKQGLVRYEKYAAAGHYRLNVSDVGVSVDFYGGSSHNITKSFVLRP